MTNSGRDSNHEKIRVTTAETPLLSKTGEENASDLRGLRLYLKWSLLELSTPCGRMASAATFLLLGVAVPGAAAAIIRGPPGSDPIHLNKLVHLPSSALATAAFLSLALHRPSFPLLLDNDSAGAGTSASSAVVQRRHAAELELALRRLALILLPSFLVELVHKLLFFSSGAVVYFPGRHRTAVFPANSGVAVLVLASWVYRSGLFLAVCVMFRLTCELQILRLEGIKKMFESSDVDCGVIFREHLMIRKQLWVTSHSYRFFIVGSLFIITVTQFGALLLLLGSKTHKNFLNSGDLLVCSAVEISGFFLCLVGAARITHRAQKIVSFATRWHMRVTCESSGLNPPKVYLQDQPNHNGGNNNGSEPPDNSFPLPSQPTSSFQSRQALVAYLEYNNQGITLFGFVLDRGLLHTLFVFEFSLVLWILSKVVVLS